MSQRLPENSYLRRAELEVLYANETGSVAFLDESYRQHRGRDNKEIPFYSMAAAIVEVDQLADLRREIEGYGAWRNNRMEWHTNQDLRDDPDRASALIDAINDSGVFSIVTVRVPVPENGEWEARNAALARLGYEVTQGVGAPKLLIADHFRNNTEAGRAHADKQLIGAMAHSHILPEGTSLQHGHPGQEQLLWVPDLVAYTFRRHMALAEDDWFPRLENVRTISAEGPELTQLTDHINRRSSHLHQQGPGARLLVAPENRATAVSSDPTIAWSQAGDKPAGTVRNNARSRLVMQENRTHAPSVEDRLINAVATNDPRQVEAAARTLAQEQPVGKRAERLKTMLDRTASNMGDAQQRIKALGLGKARPAPTPEPERTIRPNRPEPPQVSGPSAGPTLH